MSVKLKGCCREINFPDLKKVVVFFGFALVWFGFFCLQKYVEFIQVCYVNVTSSSIISY